MLVQFPIKGIVRTYLTDVSHCSDIFSEAFVCSSISVISRWSCSVSDLSEFIFFLMASILSENQSPTPPVSSPSFPSQTSDCFD